jgi:hypothetical protein
MLDNDGKEFGSFKVSAELTGLINPFTNPVTNAQVKETKIEVSYEGDPWEYMVDKKTYSESLTLGACEKIEKRYKDLFGVEIKLKRSFVSNPDESKSTSGTNGTSGEKGNVVVEEKKTTGTTGTSVQTEPQIYGEFTFNVEDAFLLKGNQDFDLLEILYKGLTKEEVIDFEEEMLDDEGLDEEYEEVDYVGPEEGATSYVSVQNIQNDAADKLNPARNAADILSTEVLNTNATITSNEKYKGNPTGGDYKGTVKKETLNNETLVDIMIGAIEGGYYHPTHFKPYNSTYKASGETLWGIDRYANTNENKLNGQKFWRLVDKISGYGDLSGGGSDFSNSNNWAKDTNGKAIKRMGTEGNPPYFKTSGVIKQGYVWGDIDNEPYARVHSSSAWKFDKRGQKKTTRGKNKGGSNQAWGYCYSPNIKDYPEDYPKLRECAMTFCETTMADNFKSFFSGYDELTNLINNDGRLRFIWLRGSWNGSGFFKHYAKGVKAFWDAGIRDVNELIVRDLNNRLEYAKQLDENSRGLIIKDANAIAGILGIKKG